MKRLVISVTILSTRPFRRFLLERNVHNSCYAALWEASITVHQTPHVYHLVFNLKIEQLQAFLLFNHIHAHFKILLNCFILSIIYKNKIIILC